MELTHWTDALPQALLQVTHALPNAASWKGESLVVWVHELSLMALAAAVITLGLVMLLELRSLARLRRSVDASLARVFEQLDLLRSDHAQLLESRASQRAPSPAPPILRPSVPTISTHPASSTVAASSWNAAARIADELRAVSAISSAPLAAGEARLMASLAQARTRRARLAAALAPQQGAASANR
ncbi:MAG TPA: hypothetical protein VMT64_00340 [Candidatus Binataceae bacterium]|nr:hypothetical protein [Candidatus Binataceae bacterium]